MPALAPREQFPHTAVAAELNEAGVIVSPRFGATRFSRHYFNDEEDVDIALDTLAGIL